LAFIISFSSCKDIIFNNPLDPNASKGVMKTIKIITTDYIGAGDICYDGEKIWKISPSGKLIAFDTESGTKIRELTSSGGLGIDYYKDKLYTCSGDDYLSLINVLSGDLEQNLLTSNIYYKFIIINDNKIIGFDTKSSYFIELNLDSFEKKQLFKLTGFNMGGISMFGSDIIITEKDSNSVYIFDTNGKVKGVYSVPSSGVEGVAVDNGFNIYLSFSDGKIYKVILP
jgi:outer membrane protein assembly factor BamB